MIRERERLVPRAATAAVAATGGRTDDTALCNVSRTPRVLTSLHLNGSISGQACRTCRLPVGVLLFLYTLPLYARQEKVIITVFLGIGFVTNLDGIVNSTLAIYSPRTQTGNLWR